MISLFLNSLTSKYVVERTTIACHS